MKKKAHVMTFEEFAVAVSPSGAVNRLPQIGQGHDVLVYQTYMNGELANALPDDVREFQYSDVILHRLTEKLGLDSGNFRDNLKVAEVVAVRAAYMGAILHATTHSLNGERSHVSDEVLSEYESLTAGLTHPWIVQQIDAQRARSQNLKPVLDQASAILGKEVADRAPDELNKGTIVSQNPDFTVQNLGEGRVAIHDNNRLMSIPQVGDDVTITYYRGHGPVFDNTQDIELSAPFLDPKNSDLAILAKDRKSGKEQMVVFNGITAFSAFVEAQGLDRALIEKGMDVLATKPKAPPKVKPVRTPAAEVTVDEKTGALALDYMESGLRYTVLFSDAAEMVRLAPEFGMGSKEVDAGHRLEARIALFGGNKVAQMEKSLHEAKAIAAKSNDSVSLANENSGRYAGQVVGETMHHIIQDVGRRTAVLHEKVKLDKVPAIGQKLSISYGEGRATVVDRASRTGMDR
ncbi:MAG: hypothetical protein A3J24_07205 [Deltaproteobacteria bacterium RIFCSPLOWO2_02_FULL_53_8]|nr:MAG: hypothetical protein A3J24_07205 [Deltaproteobacteria bacterium RIFCSPLOWO2_02_FULL_53_8]